MRQQAREQTAWHGLRGRIVTFAPALVLVALLMIGWELFIVVTGQPDYILPPLTDIFAVGIERAESTFLPNAWVTLKAILLGFFFGVTFGLSIGIGIFYSTTLRRGLLPIVVATQAIPVIAIAPILVIWFGFGLTPRVIVAALISFFPVVVNTIAGFSSVDRDAVKLMRSLGASGWQIFRMLRLPAASPYIFTGLKNAAAISAIGAIVGEWVGASAGLGPVMIAANAGFQTDVVFAAIFYLSFMAIGLFLFVGLVERLMLPWHYLTKEKQD